MNIKRGIERLDEFMKEYAATNPRYNWKEYMRDLREILLAMDEDTNEKA
jgi:hypothetical protein